MLLEGQKKNRKVFSPADCLQTTWKPADDISKHPAVKQSRNQSENQQNNQQKNQFFLPTVASCTLRTGDWIKEKFESVGFLGEI